MYCVTGLQTMLSCSYNNRCDFFFFRKILQQLKYICNRLHIYEELLLKMFGGVASLFLHDLLKAVNSDELNNMLFRVTRQTLINNYNHQYSILAFCNEHKPIVSAINSLRQLGLQNSLYNSQLCFDVFPLEFKFLKLLLMTINLHVQDDIISSWIDFHLSDKSKIKFKDISLITPGELIFFVANAEPRPQIKRTRSENKAVRDHLFPQIFQINNNQHAQLQRTRALLSYFSRQQTHREKLKTTSPRNRSEKLLSTYAVLVHKAQRQNNRKTKSILNLKIEGSNLALIRKRALKPEKAMKNEPIKLSYRRKSKKQVMQLIKSIN